MGWPSMLADIEERRDEDLQKMGWERFESPARKPLIFKRPERTIDGRPLSAMMSPPQRKVFDRQRFLAMHAVERAKARDADRAKAIKQVVINKVRIALRATVARAADRASAP